MTAGPLVVGYGNPLRGDDGVGWHVARQLEASGLGRDGRAAVVCRHQLVPELAWEVAHASVVVFVDASAEAPPGALSVAPVPAGAGGDWSHHLDPAALVALAARVYGTSPPAVLVTVGGSTFDAGEHLSPAVEAVLPAVSAVVGALTAAGACPSRDRRPS